MTVELRIPQGMRLARAIPILRLAIFDVLNQLDALAAALVDKPTARRHGSGPLRPAATKRRGKGGGHGQTN